MADEPAERRRWWRRLGGVGARGERTWGYPTSGNRASSMHLFWELPGRFVEVGVTLTVLDEPQCEDLYFWALQVSFERCDTGRREGAAHTGPQWAAEHPGHGAVNWGGYGSRGELHGGAGFLPSASGNANSVDYPWRVGVPYRLTVARAVRADGDAADPGDAVPPGFTAWRSTITPLAGWPARPPALPAASPPALPLGGALPAAGEPQAIRDLWAPGDLLVSPMVWSEVFARCDAAPVRVAWSDPAGIDVHGEVHRATAATVNYQAVADGGCSNTNSSTAAGPGGPAWMQATATQRTRSQGTRLPLDPR